MKTTMKIFAAIMIMLGFSMTTIGQNTSATNTIDANATVVGTLAISQHLSLEFGDLLDNGFKTIALDNTPTGTGSIFTGTQRAGIYKIQKGLNTTVSLSFPSIIGNLTGPNGALLPIDTYVAIWNTDAAVFTGTSLPTNGDALPSCGSPTLKDLYVHLGATVRPTPTTVVGNYTGEITLSATYN